MYQFKSNKKEILVHGLSLDDAKKSALKYCISQDEKNSLEFLRKV